MKRTLYRLWRAFKASAEFIYEVWTLRNEPSLSIIARAISTQNKPASWHTKGLEAATVKAVANFQFAVDGFTNEDWEGDE